MTLLETGLNEWTISKFMGDLQCKKTVLTTNIGNIAIDLRCKHSERENDVLCRPVSRVGTAHLICKKKTVQYLLSIVDEKFRVKYKRKFNANKKKTANRYTPQTTTHSPKGRRH